MTSNIERFHWLDYVIFAAMLVISSGVGVYYACTGTKQQSKEEFLMGNRRMKWFPVALSLLVSYNSGIVQLGVPAEIYLHGIQYSLSTTGTALAVLFSVFTFVPLLYKLQLVSSYEYLELRFQSKGVRCIGTVIIVISQIIYTGIAIFSPAVALEAVTGFPVWGSILCVGVVATCYTTMGGMKAVVWTDAFQAFIMVGGMLAIVITGTVHVGGWHKVWEINKRNHRLDFNFSPNPTVRMTFWAATIGRIFSWLPWYSVNQTSVQRFCSVSTLHKAKMTVLINLPSQIVIDIVAYAIGLVVFSYFSQCDPLTHPDTEQRLTNANQIVPLFVMKVLNWPGVPGLFLASVCSGSLSTVSSCLNGMAAITWEDLLKWKFEYLSEKSQTCVIKILVIIFGMLGVLTAFSASQLQGTILQIAVCFMSSSFSPIMGLYILGAFFTRTNWLGAIIGGCIGLILPMWMGIGSYFAVPGTPPLHTSVDECLWNGTTSILTTHSPDLIESVHGFNNLYTISFMWLSMIGILTTVIVGLIASVISAPFIVAVRPDDIKDSYLIVPLDRWSRRKTSKDKPEKKHATDADELNELTTL